ncbi:MAG TPA: hypothetical protein VGI06_11020, partial [Acidimicrobiales bacterium]
MVWRPPSRSNPLLALRRVVEAPDADVELPESLVHRRADHLATVRVASGPEPHGAGAGGEGARHAHGEDAPHAGADAGPRTDAEREPSLPVRRRRRGPVPSRPPASQPEPSHRSPERPVRAVITSTPAGAAAQAAFPITPQPAPDRPSPVPRQEERERRQLRAAARARRRTPTPSPLHAVPLPEAVPHEPAGPWSTTTEAPLTTPTWLRSSPRTALGGATAAATGTSAVVPAEPGIAATTAMPSRRWHPRLPTVRLPRRPPVLHIGAHPASAAPSLAPFPLRRPGIDRHLVPARQAGAAMLVCLALWGLLDAPDLYHSAQTSPIGTRRSVAVDLLHPIARASAAL